MYTELVQAWQKGQKRHVAKLICEMVFFANQISPETVSLPESYPYLIYSTHFSAAQRLYTIAKNTDNLALENVCNLVLVSFSTRDYDLSTDLTLDAIMQVLPNDKQAIFVGYCLDQINAIFGSK